MSATLPTEPGGHVGGEDHRREAAAAEPATRRRLSPAWVIVLAIVLCAVAAIFAKVKFFPGLKEDYFALNERNLQYVRSGLVVVRPTRFSRSHFNGIVTTSVPVGGQPVERAVGRNISLSQLMAAAYGRRSGTILLPGDAPHTNYDFLVTTTANVQGQLQAAIRKQLGFIAQIELRDGEVFSLKVQEASLPGLTVSGPKEHQNVQFANGRLCFTHVTPGSLTGTLEQVLGKPVLDKTGLKDTYNFCVAWNVELQRQLQNRSTARTIIDRTLAELGLALEPDIGKVPMLVVTGLDKASAHP